MKKSASLRSWVDPRLLAVSFGMAALMTGEDRSWGQESAASTANADAAWATQATWAHQMTFRPPTFATATLTPATTGFTVTRSGGVITQITFTTGGTGYRAAPRVVITGGGGTGATATAVINGNGELTAINVTNGGSGYTSNPTVTVSREIVNFNMTSGGFGYRPGVIRITATGGTLISGGAHAFGFGVIDPATGSFTGVTVASGGQYTAAPTNATVQDNAPEGVGMLMHFNTDITGNRTLTLGEARTIGQLVIGDLSGSEIYTLDPAALSRTASAADSGSMTLTLNSVSGLSAGMLISGNGLGFGTMITEINGNEVTLSQATTGAVAGGGGVRVAANTPLIFDMGSHGGGNAFLNKIQGGADIINAPLFLTDNLNARVTTSQLNLDGLLMGTGTLTSYGAGVVAIAGNNTGSQVPLWLWNRGGTGTGAQVLLEAPVGNAVGTDIRVGNVSYGNSGHAVLQLAQNRSNLDQINDRATITFDGINGRWNYFKLLGGNETVGRLWDLNNSSVIENSEGEAAPTNAILTVGDNAVSGPDADSYIGAHMRDRSSGALLSNQGGKLGLTKVGTGMLTLDGTVIANGITYTGVTTLAEGSLRLKNTTAFNSTINAAAGTTLIFERTTTAAWNSDELVQDIGEDGGADVIKMGIGPLTLSRTSLLASSVREFGSLSVRNGTLNLHGPTEIAGDLIAGGHPGTAPVIRITANSTITGSVLYKGRMGQTGSLFTIDSMGTTVRSALPTTGNPTPDNVAILDDGILHVTGPMEFINADLTLKGTDVTRRTDGARNSNTIVMADVSGLAPGMKLVGSGISAGSNVMITAVDIVNKTLTLSSIVNVGHDVPIIFGSPTGGRITGTPSITLANKSYQGFPTTQTQSGNIELYNSPASNNPDRIPDNATFISKGGNFDFRNELLNAPPLNQAQYTEKIGTLALQQGQLVLSSYRSTEGGQTALTFTSMTREVGSTVEFLGKELNNAADSVQAGSIGTSRNKVLFSNQPTMTNGIIGGYAIVNGRLESLAAGLANVDWVKMGPNGVTALTEDEYKNTAPNASGGWVSSDNVWISANQTLDVRRVINSLKMQSKTTNNPTFTLTLNANTLSIQSGGIIAGLGTNNINATTGGLTMSLPSGAHQDLILHVETGRTLNINAPIRDFLLETGANSSITDSSKSATVASTVGLVAGMEVTGNGIPAGTVIESVNSATGITLSQPASASSTTTVLTFTGGSVGLTKSGLGTTVLTGNNTFGGKTYINNGILQIDSNGRLGTVPSSFVADQLNLNGGTLLIMGDVPFSANRGVTVGASGGRLQVGNNAANEFLVDIPAPITGIGTLELVVTGDVTDATPSVLNLGTAASANNYGGGIKVDTGSLTIGSSGVINILGNNTIGGLYMEADAKVSLPGNNNFTEGIQMLNGILTMTGSNTFNGQSALVEPVQVTGGQLRLNSQNALGTGPLLLEMGSATIRLGGFDRTIQSITSINSSVLTNAGSTTPITLTFDTQVSQTFLGTISNGGTGRITVVKTGPATLNLLSPSNTFTGGVRIEEGALNVRSIAYSFLSGSIGSSPTFGPESIVIDGGVLSFSPTGQVKTDRSFTMGAGPNGAALVANGGNQTARVVLGIDFQQPGYGYITPPVAFVGNGPRTLTLGGPNAGDNEFSIELGDSSSGRTALMKIGSGTWTLGKDASYSGLTTVQEGVLAVLKNNVLGTAAIATTANPADFTFTGNLPNDTQISFTNFVNPYLDDFQGNPDSVPQGLQPNVTYYVVQSTGTTFKVSKTLDGDPVEFTDAGMNVKFVANIKTRASTSIFNPESVVTPDPDLTDEFLAGQVPNFTPISFNVTQYLSGLTGTTVTNGVLPTGLNAITTYYVINSDGKKFQVAEIPGGPPVHLTTLGDHFYYSLAADTPVYNTVANPVIPDSGPATNFFTGEVGNGAPLIFGTKAGGSLPPGITAGTVYYTVNATGQAGTSNPYRFQVATTPGGAPVVLGGNGNLVTYYVPFQKVTNDAFGTNLLGGRMDLRNVDYLTPETLFFEGGSLLVPARSTSTWNGDFQMNVNGNITINENGKLIMNGNLLGNRTITQLGEGTLVLAGEALAFGTNQNGQPSTPDNNRRAYVLQAGTLVLDYSDNLNSKLVDTATFQMGGSRRGGVLRLTGGDANNWHEEIVNTLSLQAGNNKIYRDDGNSIIRLNNIARAVGSSLYFDLARIAKVDNANTAGILGAWAIIRDANVQAYWMLPGAIDINFTVDPNTDTFTTSGAHRLANGTVVRVTSAGTLPAGLSANTDYYVVGSSGGTTLRLAATYNGMAIDVFNAGTGTHTISASASPRRSNTTTIIFAANAENYIGSAGNGRIKVEIQYLGGIGPVTSQLTGSGTEADPYHYLIRTTEYLVDIDDTMTPENENDVNGNRGSSSKAVVDHVQADLSVVEILSASRTTGPDDLQADPHSYAATFLSGGTEDSGSQELDWARNGSLTSDSFNDGFVVANSTYLNNIWNRDSNTNISSSANRPANSTTFSLRFANSGATAVNLVGGLNTIQSGGILISPTVGANDSAITGSGLLTTENQGNLQNFLLHQYNTSGDLVINTPIVDRAPIVRTATLSSDVQEVIGGVPTDYSRRLIYSLSQTHDLAPEMTVHTIPATGSPVLVGIIKEIVNGHTVKLDRNTAFNGSRAVYRFSGGGTPIDRAGSFGSTDRRRIFGVTIPANPELGTPARLSTSDIYLTMPIVGPGIPAGATVAAIVNDADITINIDHFFNGNVASYTFTPSVGVEKLGPGTAVLGGLNTYSNVTFLGDGMLRAQTLTDGGVAGSLGISSNAAANLNFNGGTLQYIGEDARTNRAFTLTEFAVMNIGHARTEVTFTGAVSGTDRLEKSGSGTMIVTANAGLNELRVDEGTLRVQIVDTNPAPATFSQSNFGTTNLMSLRMAGGTYELRGAPEGNVTQTYGGPFFLEEGASEIRVVSVKGYDANNLNSGSQNRSAVLNLMGGEEIISVTRSAGGSMRFLERPMVGGGAANITLAIPVLERQRVLPWATYGDNTSSLIEDFATVLTTTAAVVSADSAFLYDIGTVPAGTPDPENKYTKWADDLNSVNIDASEDSISHFNLPVLENSAVGTLRYWSQEDASMEISLDKTLRLLGGAILVGGHVYDTQKEIVGAGKLTGGVLSEGGREIVLHNYNPATPFHIGASIIDDKYVSGNTGSVEEGSRNLIMPLPVSVYKRLQDGMIVQGPGVPPDTVIATIPSQELGVIILSKAATSTHTNVSYTFTTVTGFVQTGVGTTSLTGTNTYTGKTFVHGGVLRVDSANAVPGGLGATGGTSHIVIEGGVLGLASGNFTRGLGTGNDQVEFKGNGGFAAYGADRTVTFGGTQTKLRYGNAGFVPDGSSFYLGSHDATHKVTLMNPLDLGSFSQVIHTLDGPADVEGELGGNLSGQGRLIKFGTGTLRLGVSNSNTGGVELAEGRLIAANVTNVFGTGTGAVQIGTSRTSTATGAGLELEIEGGTVNKRLEVGGVNSKAGTWLPSQHADSTPYASNDGAYSSTMIVNGFPAIAYYDTTNQDLKYVRATDPRGLAWGTPVTVASRGNIGLFPSLEIVNGNPGVSFYDATNGCLMFVRATDASGVFWAAPVIADANPVTTVAVQPDGKTLIAGTFTRMDGVVRNRLARLHRDGSLDTSFIAEHSDPDGLLHDINGEVRAILPLADGDILIGGTFTLVHNVARNRLARLNSDGSLDLGYNPNLDSTVNVLIQRDDGTVLVGGNFTSVGGFPRSRWAQLTSFGGPVDTGLAEVNVANGGTGYEAGKTIVTISGGNGFGATAEATVVGGVITGFTITNPGAGYSGTPTVTITNAAGGVGTGATATALIKGRLTSISVGNGGSGYVPTKTAVVISGGGGANGAATALIPQVLTQINVTNGGSGYTGITNVIISGGGGSGATAQAVVNGSGVVTGITLTNPGSGYTSVPTVTISNSDSGSGATATAVRANSPGPIVGFNITNRGSGYYANPTVAINNINDGSGVGTGTGATATALVTYPLPTVPDSINGEIRTLAEDLSGQIVAGGAFTSVTPLSTGVAVTRNRMARFSLGGVMDGTFNPNVNNEVRAILALPNGKLLVGGIFGAFSQSVTITRNRLALLNNNGTVDLSFDLEVNNEVRTMLLQPDGKAVLAGIFSTIGIDTPRPFLARLATDTDGNINGLLDTTFVPDPNFEVRAIAQHAPLAIAGMSQTNPVEITTTGAHALVTGDEVVLDGVSVKAGATANASYPVTVVNGTKVTLPVNGAALLQVASVATGTPAEITTAQAHGLTSGDTVTLTGINGGVFSAPINTTHTVTVTSPTAFTVPVNCTTAPASITAPRLVRPKLHLGGIFSNVGGATQQWAARLNPDGTADAAFNRSFDDLGTNSVLLSVNANPAIAYRDEVAQSLKYLRAADANGANWASDPLTIDAAGNAGHGIAMIIANIGGSIINKTPTDRTATTATRSTTPANIGVPVISYVTGDPNDGTLKYAVADNANGTTWSTPFAVPGTGAVAGRTSLLLVDASEVGGARPAIAYRDPDANQLKYVRAMNQGGISHNLTLAAPTLPIAELTYTPQWNPPVILGATAGGREPNLQMINGFPTTALGTPAVSYYDSVGGNLMLIRAQNASGEPVFDGPPVPWDAPTTVVSTGDVGRNSVLVMNDGVPGISYHDVTAGDVKFIVLSDAVGYSRLATTSSVTWQGVAALDGSLITAPGAAQTLSMTGPVNGLGGLKLAGAGILSLTNAANNYGTAMAGPGAAVNGGTIIRFGTILAGHNNALGQTTVELGDATPQILKEGENQLTEIHETAFGSLTLKGGRFDATHNGKFDNSDPAPGAFVEIHATVNGRTYTQADTGDLILVKDEVDHPERNGLYRVIFYDNNQPVVQPPGTMNLVRAEMLDTAAELAAGTRVQVSTSGKSYFLASSVTDLNVSPVLWVPDQADPNASLLANASGLTISNPIDINAGTGNGILTVGANSTVTTGIVTFSGALKLQDQRAGAESQTVTVTSSIGSGRGLILSGGISEASSGDILSILKTGSGVVTLPNANTYDGTTKINQGTLLVLNSTGSATGSGHVTVNAGAVLGGTGIIGGEVTVVGSLASKAILRPGDPTVADVAVETLTINQPLHLRRESVVEFSLISYNAGTQTAISNQLTAASLTTEHVTARLNVLLGAGYTPAVGDEFDILNLSQGLSGNMDLWLDYLGLPTSIIWDTSKFISEGKIKVEGLRTTELIATHPVGQTVNQGASVTFTVVPAVGITPSYQWRKNGVEILNANSATLQFNNITEANEGNYSVEVTTIDGSQISLAAALAVEDVAVIPVNGQPQDVVVDPGATATFTVTATADPETPITGYQWYKVGTPNDILLTGETSNTLILTNVQQANEGGYRVAVINGGGVAMSNIATLTVNDPVVLTSPTTNFNVTAGEGFTYTFTVQATGTNLQYEWQRAAPTSNTTFVVIAGANSATYTTPTLSIAADDGARYRVRVFNHLNSRLSAFGTLKVVKSAPQVTTQPDSKAILAGGTLNLSITAAGVPTLTYQWKRNGVALVEGLQTNGARVIGAKDRNLSIENMPVAMNGAFACEVTSGDKLKTLSASAYVIVVGDTVVRTPIALGKPVSLKAVVGIPASIPKADALHTITYEWQNDGVPLNLDPPGTTPKPRVNLSADQKTLSFTKVEAGDSGVYSFKVTYYGTAPVGDVAELEVFNAAPDILDTIDFPTGIVGGAYSYLIPVDDNPAKAPTAYAWAGDTKSTLPGVKKAIPAGLKLDAKTGMITGIPAATAAGTYALKVTVSNSAGKEEMANLTLVIEALPTNLAGDYAGPLPRHEDLNQNMGGRFDVKVTTSGSFSGKLTMGAASFTFTGPLKIVPSDAPPQLPNAEVTVKRGTAAPLTLTFTIDPATQRVTAGKIKEGADEIDFTAWKQVWNTIAAGKPGSNPATAYEGEYTVGLNIAAADEDPDAVLVPQGVGYIAFKIAKAGTLTLAGKTADGEGITGGQFVGPDGEILIFSPLYTTKIKGSLLGTLFIDDEGDADTAENADPLDNVFKGVDTLSWLRPENTGSATAARTYRAGFGPIPLTAVGGRYFPAGKEGHLRLLGVTGIANNARIEFMDAGIEDAATDPDLTFNVDAKNAVKLPPAAQNPAKVTLTVAGATGIFSGAFSLSDADPRGPLPTGKPRPAVARNGVKFFGLIIRNGGVWRGYGSFLLPQLPDAGPPEITPTTSPIRSGMVDLHALP